VPCPEDGDGGPPQDDPGAARLADHSREAAGPLQVPDRALADDVVDVADRDADDIRRRGSEAFPEILERPLTPDEVQEVDLVARLAGRGRHVGEADGRSDNELSRRVPVDEQDTHC
jgi:hypothetical protein